jgi:hypothetical protein
MTQEVQKEIERLEHSCGVTFWAARDDDDPFHLRLFRNEPKTDCGVWNDETDEFIDMGNILPQITFENSPKQVEIKILD